MLQVLDNPFIETHYNPVCFTTRSTLEFILQNDCLDGTMVTTTLKKRIDGPNARNPGIYDLPKCCKIHRNGTRPTTSYQ